MTCLSQGPYQLTFVLADILSSAHFNLFKLTKMQTELTRMLLLNTFQQQ
jgi:hypothetical protein